jgi:hypothetical protein
MSERPKADIRLPAVSVDALITAVAQDNPYQASILRGSLRDLFGEWFNRIDDQMADMLVRGNDEKTVPIIYVEEMNGKKMPESYFMTLDREEYPNNADVPTFYFSPPPGEVTPTPGPVFMLVKPVEKETLGNDDMLTPSVDMTSVMELTDPSDTTMELYSPTPTAAYQLDAQGNITNNAVYCIRNSGNQQASVIHILTDEGYVEIRNPVLADDDDGGPENILQLMGEDNG